MPAWLIPYWIADMLMTFGLVLIGVGSAGLALIWLRTRLGGGISKASLRSGRPIPTALRRVWYKIKRRSNTGRR
jgi:hypothetical protein